MEEDVHCVKNLEINQDLDHQQSLWMAQRVGWGVLGLAILAALLGLFGSGLLSSIKADSENGSLRLEYDRFGRCQSSTKLQVYFRTEARSGGNVRIWLSRDYLERVQIQQVMPEPDSVETGPDRQVYVFQTMEPNQPTIVTFHLEPEQIGPLPGLVGIDKRQLLRFNQFVYP